MSIIATTLGWIGTVLIVAGYILLSMGKVNGRSKLYQAMTASGAVLVAINVGYQGAWPALALQLIFVCIGSYTLFDITRNERKKPEA